MDDERFDLLTKALTSPSRPRRRVVPLLATGLAGLVLGAPSLPSVAAKHHKHNRCKKGAVKCGKKCCCVSQSKCGRDCVCLFDVKDKRACYEVSSQDTCCDSTAECGEGRGCVKGACLQGGQSGACFTLCA